MTRAERAEDTVVVGAGPAGLAVAACLRRRGLPVRILERGERVGTAWRRHYRRLHLHTDKKRSTLPHQPFPREYPRYPSRRQVVDYLESYARRFDLSPRFGEDVVAVQRHDGEWLTRTASSILASREVVIATGYNRCPHVPGWLGQDRFRGRILHSSDYRDGEPFRGRRVLVVGFGNSGGEIAIDLHEHGAEPALSIRSPVNVIPRELFGLPILAIAAPLSLLPSRLADALSAPLLRWAHGDLRRLGLVESDDGPFTRIREAGRIPLIDVGTVELIERGAIEVLGGVATFGERELVFEDGARRRFDAVILATGYRPALDDLLEDVPGVLGDEGAPLVSGGTTAAPGLYFCGFEVTARGMLRDIADEARRIAKLITERR